MSNTNQGWIRRDRSVWIHPLHHADSCDQAHVWVKADGIQLTDADGRVYLDGCSGMWNVISGHGRAELVEAAMRQMSQLPYTSSYAGNSHIAGIELAERLEELTYPSISRFFFTSGGGEATDTSIKTARFYWRQKGKPSKTQVISRNSGYHGATLAAMSAAGIEQYKPNFYPSVPGFLQIRNADPYRTVTPPGMSVGQFAAQELEQTILRMGADNIAMFIAEPVQGAGGVIVPPDEYFPLVRAICDRHHILFVADEVITAFGRTGRMFGLEHWNVQPDLIQFAKGITSGYFPLGGVGFSEEIASVIDTAEDRWMHSYTYSGHPVGCAVALRNLEIVEEEDFAAQAAVKGEYLLSRLKGALAEHPIVGDIRGLGLMLAIEPVLDHDSKLSFPPEAKIGQRLQRAADERGLIVRLRDDIVCLAPPIISSFSDLDQIVEIVTESFDAVSMDQAGVKARQSA